MRRKLIPHGQSSITVSLPSQWVKNNNLKKGNEVDIIEDDNNLVIKQVYAKCDQKSIDVNFSDLSPSVMKSVLLVLHRKNYDEIQIQLGGSAVAKSLQSFLNEMQLGFEIIKQEKDHVTIKSITNPESEQFDNLFRRIFRIAIEYSRKIEAVLTEGEDRTYSCLLHETSISRISNYCRKIIVKERKSNACFYYSIIGNLSNIVKSLTFILDDMQNGGRSFSDAFLEKYGEMCDLFSGSYELNYKFNIHEYGVLSERLNVFRSELFRLKVKRQAEQEGWNNLILIADNTLALLDSVLSMQF